MTKRKTMGPEQSRSRGRPRLFDRDDVLRRAMHVFWRKGFEETSVLDLTQDMGMTAPSVYLAFGSKEKLFEEAFLLYLNEEAAGLRSLQEETTGKEGLRRMLRNVIAALTGFAEPRGCMSIVGSLSLASQYDELRTLLRETRQATLTAIQVRLDRAVEMGELGEDVDTAALACLCRTIWSGISIQILDGVPRLRLFRAIDLFVNMIGFAAAPGRKRRSGRTDLSPSRLSSRVCSEK